jgi:hypothetical protein
MSEVLISLERDLPAMSHGEWQHAIVDCFCRMHVDGRLMLAHKKPSNNLKGLFDGVFSRRGQIAEASRWFLRPTAFDD